jgi:hypothetical protein
MVQCSAVQVISLSGLDAATLDLGTTHCPALNVSQCLVHCTALQ